MPGKALPRRKADPEDALREYFGQELARTETRLPRLPLLQTSAGKSRIAVVADHPGTSFRGNLASLLLAACILGTAALALSCSPRTALARSIGLVVEGGGGEKLRQETIKAAELVWDQGQDYFRRKHTGIVSAAGSAAEERENP